MKQGYFPNNWQRYKDAPDDLFEPISYEDFEHWKVSGWELPESVFCIIRVTDKTTLKVKEHVYQQPAAARKKLMKLVEDSNNEITVVDNDAIHLIEAINDED